MPVSLSDWLRYFAVCMFIPAVFGYFCGCINNDITIRIEVKLIRHPIPIVKITEIFRNIYWTIKRNFFIFQQVV